MRFTGKWPTKGVTPADFQQTRQSTMDFLRNRGTDRPPQAPRSLQAQPGPRGVLLTWYLPTVSWDIAGWRIYKGTETSMFHEIRDRAARKLFVEATAGATPPVTNFFVSSINALGRESNKIQIQSAAKAESGAPTFPDDPGGYNDAGGGGGDHSGFAGTGGGHGNIRN